MSYEDLMARIAREIPELAGKLSAPRVTYVKSSRKTYISFNSSVLAGEKQFLKLEAILREMFPGRPLAVRIASPDLKADFLEDPAPYRGVLDDFLRRNYPISQRLEVANLLHQGKNYVDINKLTGASTATICRVSKCLSYGEGGYRTVIEKMEQAGE